MHEPAPAHRRPAAAAAPAASALGHLATWVGLYVAAAAVLATQLAGLGTLPSSAALGCAFTAGVAVYLLDRVKTTDRRLDPADAESQPARYGFLHGRAADVRMVALLFALLALTLALLVRPVVGVGVLLGVVGVWFYGWSPAGHASGRRPKDLLLLKNALAAAWIAGFGILVAAADAGPLRSVGFGPFRHAAVVLVLVVFADSALCDIDDAESDAGRGTITLPVVVGPGWTWAIAFALEAGAAVVAARSGAAPPVAAAWAITLPATLAVVLLARPSELRDVIDLRLPILAVVATAVARAA